MYQEINYPINRMQKKSDVRASFRQRKLSGKFYLYLYINSNARKAAGFQAGDHIRVSVDDVNPRKWRFWKSEDNRGYTLTGATKGDMVTLQLSWQPIYLRKTRKNHTAWIIR